jgi:hypothetical protein
VRGGILAGVFISEKQAFNLLAFSGGLAGFFKELFPSFCNFWSGSYDGGTGENLPKVRFIKRERV